MRFVSLQKFDHLILIQFAVYFSVLLCSVFYGFTIIHSQEIQSGEKETAIEKALYTKTGFFGANAIVPYPTEQARNRLAEVLKSFPDDSQILLKLAELDEDLGRFDEAEQEIKAVKPANLYVLANFYERRARFENKAEILEKLLENSSQEKRGEIFTDLIYLAKKHDFKKYLSPEFYQKIISQDDSSFIIFLQYIDKLVDEKNYAAALKFIAQNRAKFPGSKSYFLDKEISILILEGKNAEAEKIYEEAFNPFWTKDESQNFYYFLRDNDRYSAYRNELRLKFKKDPTDYQTAIRLIHFKKNEGEVFGDIVWQIKNSRAKQKIAWQADELLTFSRLLIESGDADTASRFLYTLCADFKLEKNSELRRNVLYQLFELLSDAGNEQIALSRGNMDFYESVTKSDALPGITTGILSLIFSDANPRREFDTKKETAVKLFNRAAAYRIFSEFKTEYPEASELAQMYLDIIRIYTNSKNLEVAAKTLSEFEQKFSGFKDFPDAALKLSEAYIAAKQFDKEREIYQKLLDVLGKTDKPKFPVFDKQSNGETDDLTQIQPSVETYPKNSNTETNVTNPPNTAGYYSNSESKFSNYPSAEVIEISYADVLSRYVSSLARENKTSEILDLYAVETTKYPTEQMLYEQMLQWLGQTNLAAKEFEVYQKALQNFPQKSWKDRFARWLIRNKRNDDFANYSRSLVSNFDDSETQDYLKQFVDGKEINNAESFDGQLFFGLYSLAHQRFPHNLEFVKGLLRYFRQNKMEAEWRNLLAEYYFESPEIRVEFLTNLAKTGELREFLKVSEAISVKNEIESLPYKLFNADASVWLSDFEKSVVIYRELNQEYPNDREFSEKFITISRSFGQNNRNLLLESASFAQKQTENFPADKNYQIRAGEIQAELGDYEKAEQNWQNIITRAEGEKESYLETATISWDYFQFGNALKTIRILREKSKNENLYAFQIGAIFEARQEMSSAIGEYLKALEQNEFEADKNRAKRRLKQLFQKKELAKIIYSAFEIRRKRDKNQFRLVFNFADLLFQLKRHDEAVNLLLKQVSNERSIENLREAKQFFIDLDEQNAIRFTLRQLIQHAENSRDSISYRLQLAENFRDHFETEKSSAVLSELVQKFPTNYGVLKETENFYWEIGKRERSLQVLQTAQNKARGEFQYQFSRKLAQRLNYLDRPNQAEKILLRLQTENPDDTAVFSELTDIYVRTNQPEALRRLFSKSNEGLQKQELEPRELTYQAEILRKKMISAFTRLKDYNSAAEQYIEIINREPENEENVEEAINFVKRYGGAEKLLEYYRKTAAESFKNYRWNVILAQIYEANNDLQNAAENYRTAIYNQPEMPELYESLNEIYKKKQDYEAALENIDKLLELTGENSKFVKEKVLILKKLGREADADTEKQKLPIEDLPKQQTLSDQFAEAQNLRNSETEKAVEIYRQAFENLEQNPFQNEIKSADIAGFVQTVHTRDPLDLILAKLWNLRGKLVTEIETEDSVQSGKARKLLKTLDGAMADSISSEIKTKATGNEILALRKDIETRLLSFAQSDTQTLSLLQNIIVRCGFDDLLEHLLLKDLENNADTEKHKQNLRDLINFYQRRNNFQRILEILENELPNNNLEFIRIYAETANILEITEKELSALRLIFKLQTKDDELIVRYLEILYQTNRAELETLARNPIAHQLQIINFLLSKNETDLAAKAISNSSFSQSWKLSRTAETSLKFNNLNPINEVDFVKALQISTIGEMVKQKPDAQTQLIGNDWFNLSNKYGKWLYLSGLEERSDIFLSARIENHPKDESEQFNLGFFFLEHKEFARALEHFRLANELKPNEKSILPFIGASYFQLGEQQKAFEIWSQIINDENVTIENAMLYLKTLADFGQTEKARTDLKPIFLANLNSFENESKNDETIENLKIFTQNLAKSFSNQTGKTKFFSDICKNSPNDKILPQILIEKSLIDKNDWPEFYEMLIQRSAEFDKYEHDYDFVSILETVWETDEAEILLDSEKDFEISEPKNERLEWQQKYLDFLVENRYFSLANKTVIEIENSLKGQYPRPIWLRLAKFRVKINQNNSASALSEMMKFTGIEVSPNTQKATLPNLERLNEAIQILKNEKQIDLNSVLQEAFFSRRLALGQFNSANFIGLANIEFQKGDSFTALKLLKIMTEFSSEQSKAELDSLALIKKFTNKENLPFDEQNNLSAIESLNFAAELAAEFGFFTEAASYREKLSGAAPDDAVNKIELARLLAIVKTPDDSSDLLLQIMTDKRFNRAARWQSLIVLIEIVGTNKNLWQKIINESQSLEQLDAEMWNALKAASLYHSGELDEAINLLQTNDFTADLKFLKGCFEKLSGHDELALRTFSELSESNDELAEIYGFYEPSPIYQMVSLYLKTGKIRAALDLAKKYQILKTNEKTDPDFENQRASKFKTLRIRARDLKFSENLQMFKNLSKAAESVGEFSQAIEFEKASSTFLKTTEETRYSQLRLESLQQKLDQAIETKANKFVVTEKTVSDF